MTHLLTITCNGMLDDGYVPFVCADLPELGAGDPSNAPTLARMGPEVWRLQIAVHSIQPPLDTRTWMLGIRPLSPYDFKTATGLQSAPSELTWRYELEPLASQHTIDLYYYSGWPEVTVEVMDGDSASEIVMQPVGSGRTTDETLWYTPLSGERSGGDWGFILRHAVYDYDRPAYDAAYRPLGTHIHLADGEVFDAPPPSERSAPRVETLTHELPAMAHTFTVHVMLPRDYDTTDRHYPLIFFNDGQNQLTHQGMHGGWHTDTTATHLMRAGRMQDAVLVAVEMHPDRNRVFFPAGDIKAPHGQAEIYTNFLADALFNRLQSRYRLKRDPMTTGIVGSSNGAIHAVFAGLTRPDTFGLIGSLSYAQMNPEWNQRRMQQCAQLPFHKAYLHSGTQWGPHDADMMSDDNMMVTYRLRELLLQRGMVLEHNLHYILGHGDAHNEHAWRKRLPGCLEFLFPPE